MSRRYHAPEQTRLSRAVDYVASAFPGWALSRAVASKQREFLATLKPLESSRASGTLPSNPETLEQKITPWDRCKMVDAFDTMVHEVPLLSGLVNTFVVNTVPPTGLRIVPTTSDPTFNEEAAKRFTGYAEDARQIDARQILDLWQYQAVLLRSTLGHGDAGIALMADGSIQGVSAAKIATPSKYGRHEGAKVHQGVYTGAGVAPRGYYVCRRGKYGGITDKFQYIPRDFFLHMYRPASFDDYRAASAFLSSYRHLRMAEQIMEYKLLQQKMASVFGIAIHKSKDKTTSPLSRLGTANSAAETRGEAKTGDTRPDFELFPGMGITLDSDEDISVVDSKSPGAEFENFVRLVCRYIGLSCGLPLEFVLCDWSKANYYGNRMSSMMAKRVLLSWWQVPARFTSAVYRRRLSLMLQDGTLRIPAGMTTSPFDCDVTLPPPIEVDEQKAFTTHMLKVAANVDTKEEWARMQGKTLSTVVKQRATEHEREKQSGLPMVASVTPGVMLLTDVETPNAGTE